MGDDLSNRLVVGVASSALFDLADDPVRRSDGDAAYRALEEQSLDVPLEPGTAFGLVRRLLALNDLAPDGEPLVEVVILSARSPQAGLRIMRSVDRHGLDITRAVFRQGRTPSEYARALGVDLFLTADDESFRAAVGHGLPAGLVADTSFVVEPGDELRLVLDLDGSLADGPPDPGVLRGLLAGVRRIQSVERDRHEGDPSYVRRVQVALVTARPAPAPERTLEAVTSWGLSVDDAFFLDGLDTATVLAVQRPHLLLGTDGAGAGPRWRSVAGVHVPFTTPERTAPPEPGSSHVEPERSGAPFERTVVRDDAPGDETVVGPAVGPVRRSALALPPAPRAAGAGAADATGTIAVVEHLPAPMPLPMRSSRHRSPA